MLEGVQLYIVNVAVFCFIIALHDKSIYRLLFIIVARSSKGESAQDVEEQVGMVQYEQENMIYFSASISDFTLLTISSYGEASA